MQKTMQFLAIVICMKRMQIDGGGGGGEKRVRGAKKENRSFFFLGWHFGKNIEKYLYRGNLGTSFTITFHIYIFF